MLILVVKKIKMEKYYYDYDYEKKAEKKSKSCKAQFRCQTVYEPNRIP